jgi:toxin ParE1/3/4
MKLREFSPEILADVREIWAYIAKDNPSAADAIEEEILGACRQLVRNPYLGHVRSDLTAKDVRFLLVRRKYLIVYRCNGAMLDIVRVFHGARNLASEF